MATGRMFSRKPKQAISRALPKVAPKAIAPQRAMRSVRSAPKVKVPQGTRLPDMSPQKRKETIKQLLNHTLSPQKRIGKPSIMMKLKNKNTTLPVKPRLKLKKRALIA